jgi:ABC-2 type transport system ATP-binding protein
MPVLETDGLTKQFGTLTAVNHVSLAVEPGEVFGLLGPNGAGKTTAIKVLTTLIPPTSGRAEVGGFDVVRHPKDVRRIIGYVPQLISADPQATGFESLWLFSRLYDVPREEREERVHEALAFMGLEGASHTLVRKYSGGMIRRLEIAQSMLHRPRMLFLDEPTIGLDPLARKTVWDHISLLRQRFQMTVLFTTHYMDEAEAQCDRVAILHRGSLVALGTPAQLRAAVGTPGATLGDAFARLSGEELETGGEYREIVRERRTERRLG